jgi:integrase
VRNAQEEKDNAPTVSDLWDAYQTRLSLKKKKKADSTLREEFRYWTVTIEPAFGNLKVEDITPMIISCLLDKVAASAPVSANRLHSMLSILFKVAIQKGWITIHPLQWLDKPGGQEPPRKRILTDDEIKILWTYFDKLRPNPRDILKLGLLTAQRSGEIMSMRWDDVDMDAAIWRQETNKTDTINLVPLSPQVMEILYARERKTEWVFPSTYNRAKGANTGHAKTTKNARRKVREDSGIIGWTGHDLRRTARTIMSRLNIKHHIRERVLNHSQGGIVGVYDQHDYLQEKTDAMNKLGREIYRIIGIGTEKTKITKLQVVNN